jgi:hypothetical protein
MNCLYPITVNVLSKTEEARDTQEDKLLFFIKEVLLPRNKLKSLNSGMQKKFTWPVTDCHVLRRSAVLMQAPINQPSRIKGHVFLWQANL